MCTVTETHKVCASLFVLSASPPAESSKGSSSTTVVVAIVIVVLILLILLVVLAVLLIVKRRRKSRSYNLNRVQVQPRIQTTAQFDNPSFGYRTMNNEGLDDETIIDPYKIPEMPDIEWEQVVISEPPSKEDKDNKKLI